jgi:hypothetical protein
MEVNIRSSFPFTIVGEFISGTLKEGEFGDAMLSKPIELVKD